MKIWPIKSYPKYNFLFQSWRNWVQRVSGRVLLPVSLWSVHWLPSNGSSTMVSRLPSICHVHHHHRCQNHSERSSKHKSNRDIPLNLFELRFNQSNVNKLFRNRLLGYIWPWLKLWLTLTLWVRNAVHFKFNFVVLYYGDLPLMTPNWKFPITTILNFVQFP